MSVETELKQGFQLPLPTRRQKNELLALLGMFPDKPWNGYWISSNPNVSLEWIMSHPDLGREWKWEWMEVAKNPNLTMQFFLDFLLPKITQEIEIINWTQHYSNARKDMCWRSVSLNPGIKLAEIMAHYAKSKYEKTESKWNWEAISKRSDVSLTMILKLLEKLTDPTSSTSSTAAADRSSSIFFYPWNIEAISGNPNLTAEVVLRYAHVPNLWDWKLISTNIGIVPTSEIVKRCNNSSIGYLRNNNLSHHPLLSLDTVKVNWDSNWRWADLSEHPSITIEMILAHPDFPWVNQFICGNPNLTEAHLRNEILTKLWMPTNEDVRYPLSRNINLSATFIVASNYCNWESLSQNPNLTAEIVASNIDQSWNWDNLSYNTFAFHKNSLAKKEATMHEETDPVVWSALVSDNSTTVRRCLPTALAKLSLEYFSPNYCD